ESQVKIREAQKWEALSYLFPTGEATFGLSPAAGITCVPSPENCQTTIATHTRDPVSIPGLGDINTLAGEFRVSLTLPVYTFGKIEHGYLAAKRGVEAELLRVEIARAEVELNVTRAYWGLKAARAARATAGEAREELASWVKKIEDDLDLDKPRLNFNL